MEDPDAVTTDDSTRRLAGFEGHLQAQETWCWAAAMSSVDRYFRSRPSFKATKSFPQCYWVRHQHPGPACRRHKDIVQAGLPHDQTDCLDNGCAVRDNDEQGFVGLALAEDLFGILKSIKSLPIGLEAVMQEIDRGFPMLVRVERSPGTYHLIVIYGYNQSSRSLVVWDPSHGERIVRMNQFGSVVGRWTHTIRLQEPPIPT